MYRTFGFALILAIILIALIVLPANAGGPAQPMFSMWIHGLPGSWEYQTGDSMEAWIDPPFYNDGESNVPFAYPDHSDQFSVCYWLQGNQKYKIQSHSRPNQVGDMPFEGKIEVGANDPRTSLTIDWWIDNYQSPLSWYVSIYRIDTRQRVFSTLFDQAGYDHDVITIPMSRSGYDVFAVAFDPTAPVPEPSSLLALGSGLLAFGGFVLRRRR